MRTVSKFMHSACITYDLSKMRQFIKNREKRMVFCYEKRFEKEHLHTFMHNYRRFVCGLLKKRLKAKKRAFERLDRQR